MNELNDDDDDYDDVEGHLLICIDGHASSRPSSPVATQQIISANSEVLLSMTFIQVRFANDGDVGTVVE